MSESIVTKLKNELREAEKENSLLKQKYNSDIVEMHKEIDFLKEQLMAQQGMLNDAINYATNFEKKFEALKKDFRSGSFQSIH